MDKPGWPWTNRIVAERNDKTLQFDDFFVVLGIVSALEGRVDDRPSCNLPSKVWCFFSGLEKLNY